MAKIVKRIPGGRLGNLLAGAAVASVIGGTAVAITSPSFTYTQVQRGYYTINVMAMAPDSGTSADDYVNSFPYNLDGTGCFVTGVNLPHGATVVGVTTWFRSNAAGNLAVFLYRQNLPTNTAHSLAVATIFDDSNVRKPITHTVPVNLRTVDNLYFAYGYAVCLQPGTTFYGARINYLFNSAGD